MEMLGFFHKSWNHRDSLKSVNSIMSWTQRDFWKCLASGFLQRYEMSLKKHPCLRGRRRMAWGWPWSGRMLLSRAVCLKREAQIRVVWLDSCSQTKCVIKRKQVHTFCVSSKHICRQNGELPFEIGTLRMWKICQRRGRDAILAQSVS